MVAVGAAKGRGRRWCGLAKLDSVNVSGRELARLGGGVLELQLDVALMCCRGVAVI